MLSALILVCSISITPDLQGCTPDNARALLRLAAEFDNAAACLMQGQALLAGTSFGQELTDDDRVKIVCARSETISASVRRLIVK